MRAGQNLSPENMRHRSAVTSSFPEFIVPGWSKQTLKQNVKATLSVVLLHPRALAEANADRTHVSPGPRQFEDTANFQDSPYFSCTKI